MLFFRMCQIFRLYILLLLLCILIDIVFNKPIQNFERFCRSPVSLSDVTAHITPISVTSPVSTAAKVTTSSAKTTTASSEPDMAFPAVLKGSQKQRVPPPVPPRGSPKAKRGGATSQASSIDTKGDYPNLNISVNDIPPQTPITSSDDDFCFYGHDFKFKEPTACRIPPSVSNSSVKITKLVASNSFLDFVEEADSITERSHLGKDLIAQTSMMAKFNIDKVLIEHLDSGDYDDTSLTESSSEERIVVHEIRDPVEEVRAKQSKSPSQFVKEVVTTIGDKLTGKTPTDLGSSTEKVSVHNVKSSDLIFAARSLKKVAPAEQMKVEQVQKPETEVKAEKNGSKQGIISGISKKLNFNQSKRDKNRSQDKKPKPKVEIRTYMQGMTKDEVVCQKKAKAKIDLFQKHIIRAQTDSDSSRRSSISSSQESKQSDKQTDKQRLVKETKKIFEPIEYTHGSLTSIDKKNFSLTTTVVNPVVSKSISGNVHEKIKQFSVTPLTKTPNKIPRKKKSSFKRKSDRKKVLIKMRKDIEEIL
ncbi:uncharacterized protein LOC124643339 [Helicoverpa zea]|uniref:uncharacterized protein LOC124643339 n=1 Tax=Helicoverpa zea TaxID=7113 RepID=UPI001F5732D5|nr:uncharacterized protein LOC124643339 [Helicoverpa zea]